MGASYAQEHVGYPPLPYNFLIECVKLNLFFIQNKSKINWTFNWLLFSFTIQYICCRLLHLLPWTFFLFCCYFWYFEWEPKCKWKVGVRWFQVVFHQYIFIQRERMFIQIAIIMLSGFFHVINYQCKCPFLVKSICYMTTKLVA